jgi:tetratricopeptide (TPR) repeat protein
MKKLLFAVVLVFGITSLNAQDKTAKDYKIEGADAYKAKDYKGGLAAFEKSIQLYEAEGKTDTTLYYNAAICAIKIDDYQKSVSFFDQSIALDYKACKSALYKANALDKLGQFEEMERVCNEGVTKCPKYKSKFNEIVFKHYLIAGLDIFNDAAQMQATATPLAQSNPDQYKADMEKVKARFTESLPLLEKAHEIDPGDESCKKALKQAYELLDMGAKASSL